MYTKYCIYRLNKIPINLLFKYIHFFYKIFISYLTKVEINVSKTKFTNSN